VDINTSDISTPTHNQIFGLITRTHARQLNNQVSSFLASYSSYLDNRNVCSILLLRNDGQEGNRVAFAPDSRRTIACDGLPDHVWTWIQACKYFLESSWSLLSYASNLKSISYRRRPQSSFWCRDLFSANGATTPYFCSIGPCIMLSSIRTHPRVGA
jgi:hypothetical protein